MADLQTSPEYSTIHIDDVNPIFKSIIAKQPVFASLINFSDRKALNHKHEWLEYKKSQTSWMVDGDAGTGVTTLVLDSNTGVKVGDVLKFVKPSGGSTSVKAKVTVVDGGGTNLTITRIGTDEIILDNSVVYLVSRAVKENSSEDLNANAIPARKYNYTQIFRRDLALSRTALQTALHGLSTEADITDKVMSLVEFQVENQLRDVAYEFNLSLLEGVKELRVDGGANGAMGGLLPFIKVDARSQLDAAAADVSPTILNNAVNQALENGANGGDLTVMLCHPRQARKISAFNTSGNNPIIVRSETTAGSYVARYQSDLGGSNGGALTIVVVDRNFPEDEIVIMNPNQAEVVPMQNFFVEETTDKKTDGRTWKLIGELTAEFRNANDEMIVITNLGL
jgi:hypothetical protein